MYLSRVRVENFRVFGSVSSGTALDLQLKPGLTLIIGENDSGKSALIDAIRIVLGTQSYDPARITVEDFHLGPSGRAKDLRITCEFAGFTEEEAGLFLEWLRVEGGQRPTYMLEIALEAVRRDISEIHGRYDREVSMSVTAGGQDAGTTMDINARDSLRATYLRALRDAEQELAAKRGSRLSQILMAHPALKNQIPTSTSVGDPSAPPQKTLLDIVKGANKEIEDHPAIEQTVQDLNSRYLGRFILGDDNIKGGISISDPELRRVLEQLQLALVDGNSIKDSTRHGLGMNNLLFIATELLLLESGKQGALPLALIEEPEAHLHPQLQIRLVEALQSSSGAQIIMSSHSPNLASMVAVDKLVLMNQGRAFPLAPEYTRLDTSDYAFLGRFLDVTKANLFFARGVVLVEGDAEHILLPTIAELLGMSFSKYGVSIVNVGHVGFFRYSRIFQRASGEVMDIRVACLGDRDIPPAEARSYLKKTSKGEERKTEADLTPEQIAARMDGKVAKYKEPPVKYFVSNWWTFEYDLARSGLELEVLQAVLLADRVDFVSNSALETAHQEASDQLAAWRGAGDTPEQVWARIYQPLYAGLSKTVVAQFLSAILLDTYGGSSVNAASLESKLPPYLVEALRYLTRSDFRSK